MKRGALEHNRTSRQSVRTVRVRRERARAKPCRAYMLRASTEAGDNLAMRASIPASSTPRQAALRRNDLVRARGLERALQRVPRSSRSCTREMGSAERRTDAEPARAARRGHAQGGPATRTAIEASCYAAPTCEPHTSPPPRRTAGADRNAFSRRDRWQPSRRAETSERRAAATARVGSANAAIDPAHKGLGEMNPEQLSETTMQPEAHALRVESRTDSRRIGLLRPMGDEVRAAQRGIEANALRVQNLEV